VGDEGKGRGSVAHPGDRTLNRREVQFADPGPCRSTSHSKATAGPTSIAMAAIEESHGGAGVESAAAGGGAAAAAVVAAAEPEDGTVRTAGSWAGGAPWGAAAASAGAAI
jgi:hypothetical protein